MTPNELAERLDKMTPDDPDYQRLYRRWERSIDQQIGAGAIKGRGKAKGVKTLDLSGYAPTIDFR